MLLMFIINFGVLLADGIDGRFAKIYFAIPNEYIYMCVCVYVCVYLFCLVPLLYN